MRNIINESNIKSIDGNLSIRLDPICVCGMVLFVPDQERKINGVYILTVHCDNAECFELNKNKEIEIIING